ncbi:MAG TPA: polyprenyl synthetase family protein [Polyangiaceae bacterium]|nr:polyprenyl synthetase family protein [Polyangiaceae bacterium]
MNDPILADPSPDATEPALAGLPRLLSQYFSERSLEALLGPESAALDGAVWQRALRAPVLDFVERPSKALRAALVSRCHELAGGVGACPDELGAIVEILHAGSLIIDDIEDGSTSRRGRPALHALHGVPVALNAGNWMYFWALDLVQRLPLGDAVQLSLYRWVLRTLLRSHHGQGLDLTANVYALPQGDVPALVRASTELKTGALMELSAVLGALAAGARPALADEFARFGREVGVALQMLDDVGGLVSEKRCHKGHEDVLLGRPTWPWAWLALELRAERYAELVALGSQVAARSQHPELLARELRAELRGSGRVRIRRHLHAAFARLEAAVGASPALSSLRAELQRMEKSYA